MVFETTLTYTNTVLQLTIIALKYLLQQNRPLNIHIEMKKRSIVLIFALATALSVSVQAQKISWDIIVENDVRYIGTESKKMKIDKTNYDFYLAVFSGSLSKEYSLIIGSIWEIEDSCVVMIELGDKEDVKLVATHVDVREINSPIYMPILGASPDLISGFDLITRIEPILDQGNLPIGSSDGGAPVGGAPDRAVTIIRELDYYTSYYSIDDELLAKIGKHGISKISIASGTTFKEKSWCRNKLGKYIKKSHKKLEEQMLKPIEPTNLIGN